jgi:hypothetical protein
MQWVVFAHGKGQEQRGEGSEVFADDTSELPQRAIYRRWAALMQSETALREDA